MKKKVPCPVPAPVLVRWRLQMNIIHPVHSSTHCSPPVHLLNRIACHTPVKLRYPFLTNCLQLQLGCPCPFLLFFTFPPPFAVFGSLDPSSLSPPPLLHPLSITFDPHPLPPRPSLLFLRHDPTFRPSTPGIPSPLTHTHTQTHIHTLSPPSSLLFHHLLTS